RRNEAGRYGEISAPRCNLIERVGKRSENERMPNQRARGRRKQLQAVRRPARQRQRQVSVPAARGMIMDTDAVKTCRLAADDERDEVRQGSPNRESEMDVDPGHLTLLHVAAPSNERPSGRMGSLQIDSEHFRSVPRTSQSTCGRLSMAQDRPSKGLAGSAEGSRPASRQRRGVLGSGD